MSSPTISSPEEPVEAPQLLEDVFEVFGDSPDSKETIIYLAIGVFVLIALGLIFKVIFYAFDKFRYPGWKFWSITTRQKLAILWTTSWLSLFLELFFMLSALFSISTFVYITILIADQVPKGFARNEILSIPWLYWTEFFITILCGLHILFRLYTSRRGLMVIFDLTLLTEVINGIPLLTSPFRGQFAWNFQYLRVVRLHRTLQFLAHHPKTSFSGKTYLLWSYVFTTIIMLFGAGGFFFVLENKYFTANGQIKDMIDAMYYVVITVSTCGYGDISPKTVLGRIGAILLALCALIYIPLRVARLVQILSISTSGVIKKPGGHVIVSASNHDDFTNFIGEFYHSDRPFSSTPVALLAPSAEVEASLSGIVQRPEYITRVQALQGSLSKPDNYPYYYLESAAAVMLMADKTKGAAGDAITLVTAMSLLRRFPRMPLYLQLQSESAKRTALARGLNRVLCIQELRMGILLQNAICPGFAPFLLNLMKTSTSSNAELHPKNQWLREYRHGEGFEFYSNAPLIDFVGLTFAEAALYIAKRFNITLIGIVVKREKLVAKESRKPIDQDDATSTSTTATTTSSQVNPTSSTTYSTTSTASTFSSEHSVDSILVGDSMRKTSSPKQDIARKVAAVTFDRDRRVMQTSIDEGVRQSIDMPAGGISSLLNADDFELIVEWDLMVNPGANYIIKTGEQGVVLAEDEESVLNIFCDDIKFVQALSTEVQSWKHIPEDQRNLHRTTLFQKGSKTSSEADNEGGSHESAEEDEEERTKTKKSSKKSSKVRIVEPAILGKKQTRDKALKSELNASAGMVRISKKSDRLVPKPLKDNYALVDELPLSLDDATVISVAGTIKDHIVVVGDWAEDMYDIALGLRSLVLAQKGSLRPIVFLGADIPSKAMWNRVSVFKDIFIVIGSQVDPKDLSRAGVLEAFSILILSIPTKSIANELLPDAKSLTTFLILQKLTRAHVTIELLHADTLSLILKGHAPLYGKKPPAKHPDRAEYDSCYNAYKEISKLGTSANPYFASGCVFVNSFLDSLLGTAFYNEQIVPVLAAFTSPEAFQAVSVKATWEAYPYLRKRLKSKFKDKRAAQDSNSHELETKPNPFKYVLFYKIFKHFLKYADALAVAVVRRGFDVRPYVVTSPSPSMVMYEEDIIFVLESDKIKGLSNVYDLGNVRETPGSLAEIPHSAHH